jgi:hypothetical protein
MLDDKIKSTDDIMKYTGLPTLSVVPVNDPLRIRVSHYAPYYVPPKNPGNGKKPNPAKKPDQRKRPEREDER